MGWEQRGNGRYYYHKRRIGRRVVSEYMGAGGLAELLALMDALDRQERDFQQQAQRQEREMEKTTDALLDDLADLARSLTSAVLLSAGCHTHKGEWRKRNERRASSPGHP